MDVQVVDWFGEGEPEASCHCSRAVTPVYVKPKVAQDIQVLTLTLPALSVLSEPPCFTACRRGREKQQCWRGTKGWARRISTKRNWIDLRPNCTIFFHQHVHAHKPHWMGGLSLKIVTQCMKVLGKKLMHQKPGVLPLPWILLGEHIEKTLWETNRKQRLKITELNVRCAWQ